MELAVRAIFWACGFVLGIFGPFADCLKYPTSTVANPAVAAWLGSDWNQKVTPKYPYNDWSVTESSSGRAKRGELIFREEFWNLNLSIWQHHLTMSGGHSDEFQLYTNNRSNSFVKYGALYIKPTITANITGEQFLWSGSLEMNGGSPAESCTDARRNGCFKTGSPAHIINPITSARLRTENSFWFKYGILRIRARMPAGDWLWPAIRLLPKYNQYGSYPASGTMDIAQSRGNLNLFDARHRHIGAEQITSTLHFGPFAPWDGEFSTLTEVNLPKNRGFDKDFHVYGLEWTPDYIRFTVDETVTRTVTPSSKGGFWDLGHFGNNIDNPWKYSENGKIAPFDQLFYLDIMLAVGGTCGYFPDNLANSKKPWRNISPHASLEFWYGRKHWMPSWSDDTAFQIDYVRVWAL